jgi:hypothetical protein
VPDGGIKERLLGELDKFQSMLTDKMKEMEAMVSQKYR